MPTGTTTSSSGGGGGGGGVFGRFRRQTTGGSDELYQGLGIGTDNSPQLVDKDTDQTHDPQQQHHQQQQQQQLISPLASPTSPRSPPRRTGPRRLRKEPHRRESSLLSLSSSGFRRSTSLRSHRSQLSAGSTTALHHQQQQQQQQRPQTQQRNHSSGDLLLRQHTSSTLDSLRPATATSPPLPPPSPPRPKSKLSFSARPFSRSLKSNEALPLFGRDGDLIPDVPSLTAYERDKKMMTLGLAGKRVNERQSDFASTVSLVRDVPPSSHGGGGDPASFATATPPLGTGIQTPQVIFQHIQETATKRLATIQYIKKLHEGDVFFFNTLNVSQGALSTMPSLQPQKTGRRATGYFYLGYSLPILAEMNYTSAIDYLKPLITLLQEFDTYQGLAGVEGSGSLSRGRMGAMFSGMGLTKGATKGRRASASTDIFSDTSSMRPVSTISGMTTATDNSASSQPMSYDFTYLLTPHMPFDPDFNTTLSALCDTLVEMYNILLSLLAGPDSCTVAVADAFNKADKAIRKVLIANVVKEFEEHTRSGAKAEMAGLSKLVLGGLM